MRGSSPQIAARPIWRMGATSTGQGGWFPLDDLSRYLRESGNVRKMQQCKGFKIKRTVPVNLDYTAIVSGFMVFYGTFGHSATSAPPGPGPKRPSPPNPIPAPAGPSETFVGPRGDVEGVPSINTPARRHAPPCITPPRPSQPHPEEASSTRASTGLLPNSIRNPRPAAAEGRGVAGSGVGVRPGRSRPKPRTRRHATPGHARPHHCRSPGHGVYGHGA